VNPDDVLAAFDQQVRRGRQSSSPAVRIERDDHVIRCVNVGPGGWSGVTWTDLGTGNADEIIAEQVRYYDGMDDEFEWKYYAYDQPEDLPERLVAAGFIGEAAEALMVADAAIARSLGSRQDPEGIAVVPVTDESGVEQYLSAQLGAFGADHHGEVADVLRDQIRRTEPDVVGILALAGDRAVAASRIEFNPGTEFAGLWGGGTVPDWRGRGVYQAMVRYRAELALERGFRYLQVDALPTSEPILSRSGFVRLTTTIPYTHSPSKSGSGSAG
jgi:hypothetical protein